MHTCWYIITAPRSEASEGYVFTGICLSKSGGGGGEVLYQMQHGTMSQHLPPWGQVRTSTPPPPSETWSLHPPPPTWDLATPPPTRDLPTPSHPPPPGTWPLHPPPPPPTWDLATPPRPPPETWSLHPAPPPTWRHGHFTPPASPRITRRETVRSSSGMHV